MANEGLRSATVVLLILFFLANVFFVSAALYDGYSNTTFGVGLFFWLYVGIVGGLWIIMVLLYLIYRYCVASTAISEGLEREDDEQRDYATLVYPKYTWEANEFFTGTFVLFALTLGPWAAVYANLGYSYDPHYDTAPLNDLNNLQLYSMNFLATFANLVSALLCVNFIWILAKPDAYELNTLTTIDKAMVARKQIYQTYIPKSREPRFWLHPGAAKSGRRSGKRD